MNFTFGTDPEFMLINKQCSLKSAIGVLSKKTNAKCIKGNYFYYDNVLAEIAVKPANSKEEAIKNIKAALVKLAQLIHPLKFEISCAENYPLKELKDEDARIAGCNPEWNVYTLQCVMPPEEVISKTQFRTAGGHIHLGYDMLKDPFNIFATIRMMDLFIGIPSLFLDPDFSSKKRRRIYGHAGTHRITDYGLEYRTLGNFWLSSPELVGLIYDLCSFVLEFVKSKNHEKFWILDEKLLDEDDPALAHKCFGYDANKLVDCINNCDKKNAEKFMTFISHYIPIDVWENIYKLINQKMPNPYVTWKIDL
jgi:hypothetical protein